MVMVGCVLVAGDEENRVLGEQRHGDADCAKETYDLQHGSHAVETARVLEYSTPVVAVWIRDLTRTGIVIIVCW